MGKLSVKNGESKSVQDVYKRVKTEKDVKSWRNEIQRIDDGREIEPGLQHDLHNVRNIAEKDVCRGAEERAAQCKGKQCDDRYGQI